jgi:light-independent protochlorophyllide reductase subunit B
MFREDFEFSGDAAASHLGHAAAVVLEAEPVTAVWDEAAEKELKKIPFFVRGKARRNTEMFAADQKIGVISLKTLYDAKAHFAS